MVKDNEIVRADKFSVTLLNEELQHRLQGRKCHSRSF